MQFLDMIETAWLYRLPQICTIDKGKNARRCLLLLLFVLHFILTKQRVFYESIYVIASGDIVQFPQVFQQFDGYLYGMGEYSEDRVKFLFPWLQNAEGHLNDGEEFVVI